MQVGELSGFGVFETANGREWTRIKTEERGRDEWRWWVSGLAGCLRGGLQIGLYASLASGSCGRTGF